MLTETTVDIEHELVIAAPIERVWSCFAEAGGLNAWWTSTASAEPRLGGLYRFGFDAAHQWVGIARIYQAPTEIEWEMTETAPMTDWLGTRVGARLTAEGNKTRLHFFHRGWSGATQHMRVSSFCWASYLRLLGRYCVMGEIVPYERRNDLC